LNACTAFRRNEERAGAALHSGEVRTGLYADGSLLMARDTRDDTLTGSPVLLTRVA
jgi:hypothetical protein